MDANFADTFKSLWAMMDRLDAQERAYWASPEGKAVTAERRAAKLEAVRVARETKIARINALSSEVSELIAERAAIRANLHTLTGAERAEAAREINDISNILAKANATAHMLTKEISK